MKKIFFIAPVLLVASFYSCNKKVTPPTPDMSIKQGLYILSEGDWGRENSSLALYDKGGDVVTDNYFELMTGETLGDTAMDIEVYGSKFYISVNVSDQVIIGDVTSGRVISKIGMGDKIANITAGPRFVKCAGGKVYVSTWNRGVAVIDTTTFAVSHIGCSDIGCEDMVVKGNNLYVALGGTYGNGTQLAVIDMVSAKQISTITVPVNPARLAITDKGSLYLTTWGEYDKGIDAQLHKIDIKTNKYISMVEPLAGKVALGNDYLYTFHKSYMSIPTKSYIKRMSLSDEKVEDISTKTDIADFNTYDIAFDRSKDELYLLGEDGMVRVFDKQLKKVNEFKLDAKNVNSIAFFNLKK